MNGPRDNNSMPSGRFRAARLLLLVAVVFVLGLCAVAYRTWTRAAAVCAVEGVGGTITYSSEPTPQSGSGIHALVWRLSVFVWGRSVV